MTVTEVIAELQKYDPNLIMVFADDITGNWMEVDGPPYQMTMVETKAGDMIPKAELPMWDNVPEDSIVKEFEVVAL
jgi:hypothetical protein